MTRIKVAVSPFFGGEDWVDEYTGIHFTKNPIGLNVYSIPENLNLTGVSKAIRLNALILVEGNIGEFNEVEEIVVEESKVEEVKVEIQEEKVEAPKEEEPKKETTKPKAKTSRTKK